MTNFSDTFKKEFYQKLLTPNGSNPVRNRADSLLIAFQELDSMNKERYTILETGCMRGDHGEWCFGDDGCATYTSEVEQNINLVYVPSRAVIKLTVAVTFSAHVRIGSLKLVGGCD